MSPETGRFTTSYAGSLDNPVSLHKYLYANANPVMNTDPTGYFSLMDTTIAQGIQSTIDSVIVPYFNVKKIMSWANMAVTAYDVAQQIRMIYAGEASILGLTFALAKGFIVQALITCVATAALGEAAAWVLKAVNISMDSVSFVEAVKSGAPEKIIVESLRLSISIFTLSCQCFTGETLVSTAEGETRIDEIKTGDMVWSYDTEKGENVLKKVTKVKESETDVIVHVKTSDGKDINTTMFHPFMTEKEGRREWKAASNLQKGDNLITENGESVCVEEVRVEKLAEKVKVYNLEVEELHVYYVAGVMVHNMCGSDNSKETELFLPDEYYEKRLPSQVEPGTRYLPKYDQYGNLKQIKMYDDYGREIIRVNYSNHGRPDVHSSPHWHEVIWNAIYPKGKNIHHMQDSNTPY